MLPGAPLAYKHDLDPDGHVPRAGPYRTTIARTDAAIVAAANQPAALSQRRTMNLPSTRASVASSIITAMIGTAATPLITAAQNSARIGSMPVKSSATPPTVANATIA